MGGGELHQQLKNLCVNTKWKYAVFWKLDHRSRMVMTLEDAYYCDEKEKDNHSGSSWFDNMNEVVKDEQYTQDHLPLAVANMCHQVYPIGEGIVGKVAATGKHLWISGDQLRNSSCSLNETLVAVAIVPYGVVQLGASHTIVEDMKLVNCIKETFYKLQSSLMTSTTCSPCVTDSWISSGSAKIHNYELHNQFENKINEPYEFPGRCELYEALGPAFCKQRITSELEMMSAEIQTVTDIPEETSCSSLVTQRSASENLLEAVVASACCSDSYEQGSKSFGQPVDRCLKGFSSESVGRCNEQLKRFREPTKVGKKGARPGEKGRRGPKDRQLIEDRIKELRQLVPNGSRCSIDTLMQRTIKHMLFMQRMMKHADKLDQCSEFKLPDKEMGIHRPASQDQGTSWAVEVGSDQTVCPIIVENIGNGQMLVEMMSDKCAHILEITHTIRRLGLTILKSATDAHGDKTWMCFVVERENNVNLHRMDILWSLLQTMESKNRA
ncbi:transcription factor EMB1444-like [Rutidosis leptorrhynchoides]|uniref:transcription factor EMB1444-like n=1 Tax=Rutidosis leptorrhynchoides TaxID=125765 RepID=UPI003A99F163